MRQIMRLNTPLGRLVPFATGAFGVAVVIAVCVRFAALLGATTTALAILLVVLGVASRWGSWPAIFTSVLGGLAFDYFVLPPLHTLAIASVQDWTALAALLITAMTVGELSGRARRRAVEAEAGRAAALLVSAYNRRLIEANLDPLVTIGRDGKITDANAAAEAITGRPRAALIGTDFADYFTDRAQARAGYERAFQQGALRGYPLEIRGPDKTHIPVLYNAAVYRDDAGEVAGVLAAAHDVSQLKRAEDEVRHLAVFPQRSPLPIIEFGRSEEVRYINRAMERFLEASDVSDRALLIPADWAEKLAQADGVDATEVREHQVGGRTLEEYLFFSGDAHTLRIWATDITERKQNQLALERLNRSLRTLSSANQTLVHARIEPDLLHDMCQVLVDVGGYRMAWVGLAEHDEGKTVRIAAVAGHDDGYVEQAHVSWADNERGRGPTGTAIRTGQPLVNLNFATDPRVRPWRAEALKRGYASSAALPLKDANGVFGALTVYSGEPEAIGAAELALFVELAGDLAYGIGALRAGVERETAVRRFYDSLEDTVGAIASTIEMRDPYTAGHQRRVAKLAARIAEEMGLPEDRIRGIQLAALIHDVGKINVPAEILSKPGALTPLELQFVRTHPQAGYDIIKGVEFPWPIAETVLQHHERLDGSGYPKGLAAEAVIAEARILAVADVTEAIMAHRPYRAALGLDAALSAIETGKGTLFDPAAVDACVALFRTKGFSFD
jgi:PAS domain S-box-containing protein